VRRRARSLRIDDRYFHHQDRRLTRHSNRMGLTATSPKQSFCRTVSCAWLGHRSRRSGHKFWADNRKYRGQDSRSATFHPWTMLGHSRCQKRTSPAPTAEVPSNSAVPYRLSSALPCAQVQILPCYVCGDNPARPVASISICTPPEIATRDCQLIH